MTTHHKSIVRRTLSAAAGLLLTALLAPTAWAQPVPEPEGPLEEEPPPPQLVALKLQKRPAKQPRRQAARQRLLLQQVGLSEARADKVGKILSRFAPERRALRQKIRQMEQRLRQLVKADSNDDGAYKNALAELQVARKELQALQDQELQALSQELTSKEQAKLVLALRQLKRQPGALRGQRGGPQLGPGNQRRGPAARRGRQGMGRQGMDRQGRQGMGRQGRQGMGRQGMGRQGMGRQGCRQLGPGQWQPGPGQPPPGPSQWQPGPGQPPQPDLPPWRG